MSQMSEYKCICCGSVKICDAECSCSVCGYRMFGSPYDRREMLIKLIKGFIYSLRFHDIPKNYLKCYRKEKEINDGAVCEVTVLRSDDEHRFPDAEKIKRYICSANKTEDFCERMNESFDRIKKHLDTPFNAHYTVALSGIRFFIDDYDDVLNEALYQLGIDIRMPRIFLDDITLDYTETPDIMFKDTVDSIISGLHRLSDKIKRFIKQNNIYTSLYQRSDSRPLEMHFNSDGSDAYDALTGCKAKVDKILSKKYVVDLLSDGSEELFEMLDTVWCSIGLLLSCGIHEKTEIYKFKDGSEIFGEGVIDGLLYRISERYKDLDAILDSDLFLAGKDEESLFDLYDRMIGLDPFGYFGTDKASLLKPLESEKKLNSLVGLSQIKESVKKIKAYALANKDSEALNVHMCFSGNPGSGKTEVARYIADILFESGILPTNKMTEVDRSGLVSQYLGATAEKTRKVIEKALGGVLFIDEAYSLAGNAAGDYGKEAVDTLVKAMEDHRGQFCVIFAGYRNEMQNMLSLNPGLRSRIQFTLDFPNYSREELKKIALLMLKKRRYEISAEALDRILDITDIRRKDPNFANARELRNILDNVIMCQNVRCAGGSDKEIGLIDVNKYISDEKIKMPMAGSGRASSLMTGEDELERLIGLSAVKRMVKKIKAYAKRNRDESDFNVHMCFYGGPGTGKTEVARILSRILYDAGVLSEAKIVETDANGLIGRYVGETGPKTKAKIGEANGGVLFIDEAYALTGNSNDKSDYGEEAIATLLKEMEDNRGRFCVIFAGYKKEMEKMLSSNPGLRSRIQFTLEFPDYTREELGEIAFSFLEKKHYTISPEALSLVLDATDRLRTEPDFANARTVRNILDQVIMNQNLRTEDERGNDLIILSDVEEYIADEGIDIKGNNKKSTIGFA